MMQSHLDQLYTAQAREFGLTARSITELEAWKTVFRARLWDLLGLQGRSTVEPYPEKRSSLDCGAYWEEKYTFSSEPEVRVPFYLLRPKRVPPYKPLLIFHGHDPSAQFCLGHYPDADIERTNLALDNNYAQALARAGYLVGVVEQRGLGERVSSLVSPEQRSCRHLAFYYLLHGRVLLGERVWDGLCAASFLLSQPDTTGILGCAGHSGGGATALWLAALDERIRVVLVSGFFSSFRASILGMDHCECNYVPGILELGEMGDLAALLAPRPFCALNGQQDPIFPLQAARDQFETVRRAYRLCGTSQVCELAVHPGGHAFDNQRARAWFDRWMAGQP